MMIKSQLTILDLTKPVDKLAAMLCVKAVHAAHNFIGALMEPAAHTVEKIVNPAAVAIVMSCAAHAVRDAHVVNVSLAHCHTALEMPTSATLSGTEREKISSVISSKSNLASMTIAPANASSVFPSHGLSSIFPTKLTKSKRWPSLLVSGTSLLILEDILMKLKSESIWKSLLISLRTNMERVTTESEDVV